jgi:hypothetical protein
MKRILIFAAVTLTALVALSCSNSSGPGDPALTYDLVKQDVNAYKGKRVRWYGRQVSFESTGGVTRATFANMKQWQTGGDMQPFVVEIKSDRVPPELSGEGWVSGTVEGTRTVGITLGSPSGRESTRPQTVPLLSNPELEKASDTK